MDASDRLRSAASFPSTRGRSRSRDPGAFHKLVHDHCGRWLPKRIELAHFAKKRCDENMILSKSQREIAIRAPCFALRFLVHPDERVNARASMPGFSDAAVFHRWMSLSWSLGEPEAFSLLTAKEKQEADEFYGKFLSLPWIPIESHSFISEVSELELNKLVPTASTLLDSLENRLAESALQRCSRWIFYVCSSIR